MELEKIIAHHQVVFKYATPEDSEYMETVSLRSRIDLDNMRKEIKELHKFFSNMGDVIDLNLDYCKEFIVVTFRKHSDVRKIIQTKHYFYKEDPESKCEFVAQKIEFILPVRQFKENLAIEEKFLPQEFRAN